MSFSWENSIIIFTIKYFSCADKTQQHFYLYEFRIVRAGDKTDPPRITKKQILLLYTHREALRNINVAIFYSFIKCLLEFHPPIVLELQIKQTVMSSQLFIYLSTKSDAHKRSVPN